MTHASSTRTIAILAAIVLATPSLACRARRAEIPPRVVPPAPVPQAAAAAPPTTSIPEEPGAKDRALDHSGSRQDSLMYEIRLLDVRRCERADAREGAIRLAIRVAVRSHIEGLLVTARDFSLEHGGVIFEANTHGSASGCGSPLEPRSLPKAGLAQGTVTFDLPDLAYARSTRLVYEATRWGGAPRLQITLPDCLEDCGVIVARHANASGRARRE